MPYKDPEAKRANARIWRANNRKKTRGYNATYRGKHPAKILASNRLYHATHAEQESAYGRAYRLNHPEQERERGRNYRLRHPEKAKQRKQRYRAKPSTQAKELRDKIAYRATHQEEILAYASAYARAHPEICVANVLRRRARKLNAPLSDLTHAQWLEIQAAQDHRCYYCGTRAKGHLTQDHIQPLSKGGSHTLHNIIGACKSCNSKKHTGPPPVAVQPFLLTIAPAQKKKVS